MKIAEVRMKRRKSKGWVRYDEVVAVPGRPLINSIYFAWDLRPTTEEIIVSIHTPEQENNDGNNKTNQ